jgi:hypothetical protein
MPTKTIYKKKKPLIINSDSDVKEEKSNQLELGEENPKVIKQKKVIIIQPKKKQSKKNLIKIGGAKNKTRKISHN